MDETSSERAKLSRLGVHEDWKASGIGSAFLDHVEELARKEGLEATRLTTPGTTRVFRRFIAIAGTERPETIPSIIERMTRS